MNLERKVYTCDACQMAVIFYTDFTIIHLGPERHSFTPLVPLLIEGS